MLRDTDDDMVLESAANGQAEAAQQFGVAVMSHREAVTRLGLDK
jgi:hypothetical protein